MKNILVVISLIVLTLALGIEAGSAAAPALGLGENPPGLAIRVLLLVDFALLLRFGLTAFGTIISGSLQGKIDGIATLITGIVLVIVGIFSALGALTLLLLMLGLVFAMPFGTLVYIAMFGTFASGVASALLSLAMLLKAAGVVLFTLWNLHVLKSKSTVLLALTSLLMTGLVSFLHGIVPGFLTSITDAIAAIVVGIVSVIWGIVLALFAIPAVFRAVRSLIPG